MEILTSKQALIRTCIDTSQIQLIPYRGMAVAKIVGRILTRFDPHSRRTYYYQRTTS